MGGGGLQSRKNIPLSSSSACVEQRAGVLFSWALFGHASRSTEKGHKKGTCCLFVCLFVCLFYRAGLLDGVTPMSLTKYLTLETAYLPFSAFFKNIDFVTNMLTKSIDYHLLRVFNPFIICNLGVQSKTGLLPPPTIYMGLH